MAAHMHTPTKEKRVSQVEPSGESEWQTNFDLTRARVSNLRQFAPNHSEFEFASARLDFSQILELIRILKIEGLLAGRLSRRMQQLDLL